MYFVAEGSLMEGFNFYGPFEEVTEAEEFAMTYCTTMEWSIQEMCDPADYEDDEEIILPAEVA